MYRRLGILLVPLALAAFASAGTARAGDARLPATLYPPGTHITYQPRVSNAEMDCSWGFICDWRTGRCLRVCPFSTLNSLFHLRTQEQLRRVGGWSQTGTSGGDSQMSQFALYMSQYAAGSNRAGIPWSLQGLLDLQRTAWLHGYEPLARPTGLLPATMSGTVLAMRHHYGNVSVLLLAYDSGTQEVESMVSTTGGRALQQQVWNDLVLQLRATGTEPR